jgi:hypothetical protein
MGNALRTDIEQVAPFLVVGGGWITRARKIPISGRSLDYPRARESGILSNRILVAGQHVSHPDGPKCPGGELN